MKIRVVKKGVGTELKDCGDADFEIWTVMTQEGFKDRLTDKGVESLVGLDGSTTNEFAALEEGGKYGLGAGKAQAGDLFALLINAEAEKKQRRLQKEEDRKRAMLTEKQHQEMFAVVAHHYRKKAKTELDCWERESMLSVNRDESFKRELVKFYERGATKGKLLCQVLDKAYPSDLVIGSHIWKFATKGKGLERFGIAPTSINGVRNGLLLCKGLEEAFDRKQVCFLYNFLHKELNLFVADGSLLNMLVYPSKSTRFGDVQWAVLRCPPGNIPYRRLLSWHAWLTMEKYGLADPKFHYHHVSEGVPADFEMLFQRAQSGAVASVTSEEKAQSGDSDVEGADTAQLEEAANNSKDVPLFKYVAVDEVASSKGS